MLFWCPFHQEWEVEFLGHGYSDVHAIVDGKALNAELWALGLDAYDRNETIYWSVFN